MQLPLGSSNTQLAIALIHTVVQSLRYYKTPDRKEVNLTSRKWVQDKLQYCTWDLSLFKLEDVDAFLLPLLNYLTDIEVFDKYMYIWPKRNLMSGVSQLLIVSGEECSRVHSIQHRKHPAWKSWNTQGDCAKPGTSVLMCSYPVNRSCINLEEKKHELVNIAE